MKYTKSDFPDLNYKQRKEKELEDLRVASGVRYTGIDARDSFYYAVERIKWLNGKIEQRKRDGLPHFLYMRERDCLFWMMDKVKELSEKLIAADKVGDILLNMYSDSDFVKIMNFYQLDEISKALRDFGKLPQVHKSAVETSG